MEEWFEKLFSYITMRQSPIPCQRDVQKQTHERITFFKKKKTTTSGDSGLSILIIFFLIFTSGPHPKNSDK